MGAGIAGLSSAIMLEKLGFETVVYEAGDCVRGIGAGMGFASNAMKALEYLGMSNEVLSISNHLQDFMICDDKGHSILQADTERIKKIYHTDNYAIHRADLHKYLSGKISYDKIFLNKKLERFQQESDRVILFFEDGTQSVADFLIGADGVNSKIRQQLLPCSKPRFAGYWCWRGTVNHNFNRLNKSTEVWGKNGRFGITPLTGQRIYWYACINTDLKDEIKDYNLNDLKKRFKNYFPLVNEVLNLTREENLISSPIVDITPITHYNFGNILLIGDAAHATTPNMGQGACMALEDAAVLQDELNKNDIKTAFANFEKRRLKRTHYIIKTSWLAGKIAQSENSLTIFFRNNLLRLLPDYISQHQLQRLLDEDFMSTKN